MKWTKTLPIAMAAVSAVGCSGPHESAQLASVRQELTGDPFLVNYSKSQAIALIVDLLWSNYGEFPSQVSTCVASAGAKPSDLVVTCDNKPELMPYDPPLTINSSNVGGMCMWVCSVSWNGVTIDNNIRFINRFLKPQNVPDGCE